MKKILGLRTVLNITFLVMLIGGIVYALGFGISLYIARQEITKELDQKVERDMKYIQTYVDGQLQRVEDVAYTIASSKFGNSKRDAQGNGFVVINPKTFVLPSEPEVFELLEQFLESNPHICGAAIGFEPFVYPNTKGEYGFAAYVTNVGGKTERLSLGEIHDYKKKEWYFEAARQNKAYWSRPFRETSHGKVVTCYSLPLHGYGGRIVGVLALDIETEQFRKKCEEVAPFPNSQVTLADRNFCFVSHPDTTFLLKSIKEVGIYNDYKVDDSMKIKMEAHQSGNYKVNEGTDSEAFFYFCPIERNGWTVTIECPTEDVYGGISRMKRDTTIIAVISILFMIVSFVWLFRNIQKVTLSKASIESELNVAANIQMGMIPKLYPAFPKNPSLDICGFIKPAKSVGGDLYDYLIRDDKLFFCIGDVSGKGIPASLFMTVILALFRNTAINTSDPAKIMSALNTTTSKGNTQCMFCTMFIGVLDIKTGHLDYCNGGHNAPVIRRVTENGVDVKYMDIQKNLAVGIFGSCKYKSEETQLKPGEAIFLYTDGVTEAENARKELFGEDKLLATLADGRAHSVRSAKGFVDYVYNAIATHAENTDQSDDITMLVVEYKGQNTSEEKA